MLAEKKKRDAQNPLRVEYTVSRSEVWIPPGAPPTNPDPHRRSGSAPFSAAILNAKQGSESGQYGEQMWIPPEQKFEPPPEYSEFDPNAGHNYQDSRYS